MSAQSVSTRFAIQPLLSARLLLSPQLAKGKVYFLSDMSGVISLYRMEQEGSLPESLLPAGLALQNPQLMVSIFGRAMINYCVLPKLDKILVMIDENGNENYQPCFVPASGGIPRPIFGNEYENEQVACLHCDVEENIAYFFIDDRKTPTMECLKVDLSTLETSSLGRSIYGSNFNGVNKYHDTVILADSYSSGDTVLYIWRKGTTKRQLLYGTPIGKRAEKHRVKRTGIGVCNFTPDERGLLFKTNLFSEEGSVGYIKLEDPGDIMKVQVSGVKHKGAGVLVEMKTVHDDVYLLEYNIDGCSWLFECKYCEMDCQRQLRAVRALCGLPPLDNGVLLGYGFETRKKKGNTRVGYVLSFAKANVPSQIYLYAPNSAAKTPKVLSRNSVVGVDGELLSPGEDASYTSFDGLRISARLYLPSKDLGFIGPRPLVLYVHGGPQGQERPDFTGSFMPLIQYLTLNGFAVFVPNARGSTGYGIQYMKQVNHDWGGKDRLDHVEGLKKLEKDSRIDSSRRAVVGCSYGGFMALTLASRYPNLWKAACDMFGPSDLISFVQRLNARTFAHIWLCRKRQSDLISFVQRLPETWQTLFMLSIGHPEKDMDLLIERSPITYLDNIECPMLIVQGRHDPRILAVESKKVAENLRAKGVETEFLVFEDEGHDITKFKNKVLCYTKIVDFFKKYLKPENCS